MANSPKGIKGYASNSNQLLVQYEKILFEELHSDYLDLLPGNPSRILDVGSGSGRDAAYLAKLGHDVVAVEPADELRVPATLLHPSPLIEWLDDGLPDLALVKSRYDQFDLIMLTAVWMHLDELERRKAMPILASLVRYGGALIMSLRHGPIPSNRRMFDVSADETISLALNERLSLVRQIQGESVQNINKRNCITWSRLVFKMI